MKKIDLNVDVGEGFEFDEELLEIATSASICCGQHAGNASITESTVRICLKKGVRIGIHPGYPDRASMGRNTLEINDQREYLDSILSQIRAFKLRYSAEYLKPHGGFYNDLAMPLSIGWNSMTKHPGAKSIYEAGGQELSKTPGTGMLILALRIYKLELMGLPGTFHEEIAKRAGVRFIAEGFADRRLLENGLLMPRSEPGAVILDEAELVAHGLEQAEKCDSICIHGDTPDAVRMARSLRLALEKVGYEISAGGVDEGNTIDETKEAGSPY